jgi:hypothetical protein
VVFTPEPAARDSLANPRYWGLGVDFQDWQGPPIEYFRDKMQKRFPGFK